MPRLYKLEYKDKATVPKSRLGNLTREEMQRTVIDTFTYYGGRLPKKVYRRVGGQWRLLSLAKFAAELDY